MEDEELIHLAFKRLFKRPQYGAKHRTHTHTRARARAGAGQWAVEALVAHFALRTPRVRSGSGLPGFVRVGSR